MAAYPQEYRYSKEHEWVKVSGNKARIGITDYAQQELGDVVFVDLPSVGDTITAGQPFAVVESVKSVSDVYAPVSGEIVAVNDHLSDSPELINQSPHDEGWICQVEMSNPAEVDELMTADEYQASVKSEEE